jgi:hypothetical protein
MGSVDDIAVRPAKDGELAAVAGLRWRWAQENQSEPITSYDEFVRRFVTWARENPHSHRCMVVVRGDVVIGMAWLAIISECRAHVPLIGPQATCSPCMSCPRSETAASGSVARNSRAGSVNRPRPPSSNGLSS